MVELILWGIFVPAFTVVFGLLTIRLLTGPRFTPTPLWTYAVAGAAGGVGWGLTYWALITFIPPLRLGSPHPWTPVLGALTVFIANTIMGWLFLTWKRHG